MRRNVILFSLYTLFIYSCDPVSETISGSIDLDAANLTALTLSVGTLTPVFNQNVLAYAVTLNDSDSVIAITPTAKVANAIITVAGFTVNSGISSPQIALPLAVNTILVHVTAADTSSSRTYTIVVTRVATEILEITGAWSGTDQFGAVTYVFSDAAWSTSRPGTPTAASGTVHSYQNSSNSLVFYIVAHTDAPQIGNYHKITWTPDSPGTSSGSTINLTVYEAGLTSGAASAQTAILITSHVLTKD